MSGLVHKTKMAVIIGAMVIVPLLGPNIAFSLGSSLGETRLMWQSLKAIISGIILAILVAAIISFIWPLTIETQEVLICTEVNYAGTGSHLLLAINIVCINLSAKLVFLIKGIQPRTWLGARTAKQSQKLYLLI